MEPIDCEFSGATSSGWLVGGIRRENVSDATHEQQATVYRQAQPCSRRTQNAAKKPDVGRTRCDMAPSRLYSPHMKQSRGEPSQRRCRDVMNGTTSCEQGGHKPLRSVAERRRRSWEKVSNDRQVSRALHYVSRSHSI